MPKHYKIIDDSGIDYKFIAGFGIHSCWQDKIVEGSESPRYLGNSTFRTITVRLPGQGFYTADASCFELQKDSDPEGPDEEQLWEIYGAGTDALHIGTKYRPDRQYQIVCCMFERRAHEFVQLLPHAVKNARLIVAAPNLLKGCKAALKEADKLSRETRHFLQCIVKEVTGKSHE